MQLGDDGRIAFEIDSIVGLVIDGFLAYRLWTMGYGLKFDFLCTSDEKDGVTLVMTWICVVCSQMEKGDWEYYFMWRV